MCGTFLKYYFAHLLLPGSLCRCLVSDCWAGFAVLSSPCAGDPGRRGWGTRSGVGWVSPRGVILRIQARRVCGARFQFRGLASRIEELCSEEGDAVLLPRFARKATDSEVSKRSLKIAACPASCFVPLTYAACSAVASSAAVVSHHLSHYLFMIKQSPGLCWWFGSGRSLRSL